LVLLESTNPSSTKIFAVQGKSRENVAITNSKTNARHKEFVFEIKNLKILEDVTAYAQPIRQKIHPVINEW
jgi:hypothetical protein